MSCREGASYFGFMTLLRRLTMTRITALLGTLLLFGACATQSDDPAQAGMDGGGAVPTFTVDPSWPRTMPNDWIMGSITAVFVDAQDHVLSLIHI